MICVLSCTICIVICVYLKEAIKRNFAQEEDYNEDARLSYLRRLDGLGKRNKHQELKEEQDLDEDKRDSRLQVMEFYVSMMNRKVFEENSIDEDTCISLCDKKYEKGEVLR